MLFVLQTAFFLLCLTVACTVYIFFILHLVLLVYVFVLFFWFCNFFFRIIRSFTVLFCFYVFYRFFTILLLKYLCVHILMFSSSFKISSSIGYCQRNLLFLCHIDLQLHNYYVQFPQDNF